MIKTTNSLLMLGMVAFATLPASAQSSVNVGTAPLNNGYMNVFNLPGAGGGFVFGSGWGVADLRATITGTGDSTVVTLAPNTIGDPNPFWYTPSGGPGSVGNKIMDANLYNESTGLYVGTALTFYGVVTANTLFGQTDANGNGWTSVAFIKDFAPDYSSFNIVTASLSGGFFSVSMNTINDPARHVQYGFETIGPDVWAGEPLSFANIQISAVPEPSTLALSVFGGLAMLGAIRRRTKV